MTDEEMIRKVTNIVARGLDAARMTAVVMPESKLDETTVIAVGVIVAEHLTFVLGGLFDHESFVDIALNGDAGEVD